MVNKALVDGHLPKSIWATLIELDEEIERAELCGLGMGSIGEELGDGVDMIKIYCINFPKR